MATIVAMAKEEVGAGWLDEVKQAVKEVKPVRTGYVLVLNERMEGSETVYDRPDLIKENTMLVLNTAEWKPAQDQAIIACGVGTGKALRAFRVEKGQHGRITHFAVPTAMVEITARADGMIMIEVREVVAYNGTAKAGRTLLYRGQIEKLPKECEKYRPAAEAAVAKANCKDCNHTHFAESLPVPKPRPHVVALREKLRTGGHDDCPEGQAPRRQPDVTLGIMPETQARVDEMHRQIIASHPPRVRPVGIRSPRKRR